jgi:hypothetical protein
VLDSKALTGTILCSSLKQDQNDMPRSVCHVGLGSRSKKDCFEVPEDGKNSKRTE